MCAAVAPMKILLDYCTATCYGLSSIESCVLTRPSCRIFYARAKSRLARIGPVLLQNRLCSAPDIGKIRANFFFIVKAALYFHCILQTCEGQTGSCAPATIRREEPRSATQLEQRPLQTIVFYNALSRVAGLGSPPMKRLRLNPTGRLLHKMNPNTQADSLQAIVLYNGAARVRRDLL